MQPYFGYTYASKALKIHNTDNFWPHISGLMSQSHLIHCSDGNIEAFWLFSAA